MNLSMLEYSNEFWKENKMDLKGLKKKAKGVLDKTDIDEKIIEKAKGVLDKVDDLDKDKG